MRRRAVLFDDEPLIRELLWRVFEQRGYEVLTFHDPSPCPLHEIQSCPCPVGTLCADIIISDLKMPNVNGLDFLASLIGKGCQKPRFAMTSGNWTESAIERAEEFGCKVFHKPFNISEIIEWLEEVEPQIPPERELLNWHDQHWQSKQAGSS